MENYETIANIGKGSSGAVFLARSLKARKLVAIKRIEIDENRRSRCKKSVVREASILRRLNHPYIVECEEWFLDSEEKLMHIVLEYCNGGTMQDSVRQVKNKKTYFPEEKTLKWMTQIVSAVAFMHSKKILHRDLKTENIFIVKPDTAKLGDFGISKEIDHTLDMAQTCVGTPCYLSPELCQDIPYSSKSDVWALGCLLFEMAALKPAFDAANLVSLFYKIVKGDFAPLPDYCSKNMLDLISVILQKDPEKRPTAAKLLEHPTLTKYADLIHHDSLPKGLRKSAKNFDSLSTKKKPPMLVDLRGKSGNVEELSSFENSGTITNDDKDRTLTGSPDPMYAYNMFLSGVKSKSTLERYVNAPVSKVENSRALSVLGVPDGKINVNGIPKLFAYHADPNVGTASPPPQEVETARPQTCPHSASRTRTEPVQEETFTDTVVTWSGYGDRGTRHQSGRRCSDSLSFSSDSDESSDSDIDIARRKVRNSAIRRVRKSHDYSFSSDEDDISEELLQDEFTGGDDDIPEVIEQSGGENSGDSTHTGDEQYDGDSGRVLPGSAWLRSKRMQVLQRKQSGTKVGKSSGNDPKKKKVRLPGSSWLSKEQREEREKNSSDVNGNNMMVLGQNHHTSITTKEKSKDSTCSELHSGNIRNLPGSAWLKNSSQRTHIEHNISSSPEATKRPHHLSKQPSMVLESFSSESANEYGSPDKGKSDTDAEYNSDESYPDDFEDYEDDFELSDDDLSDDERFSTIQSKSSLNLVRQGCIDLLGEEIYDDLTSFFKKGLTFSEALCRFNSKKVDAEALEACYLLLQNQ